MKKLAVVLVLLSLSACGTVTIKEGNKECKTMTLGLFGGSIGAPFDNGCK
jgi:hypothetical protein